MKKYFRVILVIAMVLGVLIAARGQTAWAGQNNNAETTVDLKQVEPAVLPAKPGPGSVKPPPEELQACEPGDFSVGGVSILKVKELDPGYCVVAWLRNHAFALGRIPDGAGKVLAHITFLQVFYQSRFVYEVPAEDGSIEICYAVPPGIQSSQIYFFDFYGPRFGQRTGQPAWEPLPTTVTDGVACAPAQTSGAYALIGK